MNRFDFFVFLFSGRFDSPTKVTYTLELKKKCHNGRGKQQRQDAGAHRNGTVAQIPFAALNRLYTSTSGKAVLDPDAFMLQ